MSKPLQQGVRWLSALWKFSRPHTIIGTTLSVMGLAIMAQGAVSGEPLLQLVLWIFSALIPSLCANIYIVGLNQLEDIEIDRINKPALPLASGEFSRIDGLAIVGTTGTLALILSVIQGNFLFFTVMLSMAIGTVYSLPPLRLKRFPFWAAFCIFGVRGFIVNLGFFLHFQQILGGSPSIPPQVWALTWFVVLFAFAIAIFKDIPDAKGDRLFQIRTLTLRLGIPAVFNLARWVLTACYGMMIVITILGWLPIQSAILIVTHIGLIIWLWIRSLRVNLHEKDQISQFYQFIWKLFFLEYLIFPLTCLWQG